MTFSMTVLGCGTPYPRPDVACSGYLLRADGVEVWVDAGPGTLANLQRYTRLDKLAAIWLSHLHIDHCNDLLPTYYALAYGGQAPPSPIPVFGPAGWVARMEGFLASARPEPLRTAFQPFELTDGHQVAFGGLTLRSVAVEHGVPAFGLTARYGERRLAYTGDSGPCDSLVTLAKGARVLVAEVGTDVIEIPSVHLAPEDAGITAAAAGVSRLVLTHLAPGLGDDEAVERAGSTFNGAIEIARPGTLLEV